MRIYHRYPVVGWVWLIRKRSEYTILFIANRSIRALPVLCVRVDKNIKNAMKLILGKALFTKGHWFQNIGGGKIGHCANSTT